jgi:hypothetical protein
MNLWWGRGRKGKIGGVGYIRNIIYCNIGILKRVNNIFIKIVP